VFRTASSKIAARERSTLALVPRRTARAQAGG